MNGPLPRPQIRRRIRPTPRRLRPPPHRHLPHTGRKALTLRTLASNPPADNLCIAQLSGFSLHAGTRCQAHERNSLESRCRYITRPAVSNEHLSVNDRWQGVYRLKHSSHSGTIRVVFDPTNFFARLAAPEVPLAQQARSMPHPRAHVTRYHGVFAQKCKHRHHIVPNCGRLPAIWTRC